MANRKRRAKKTRFATIREQGFFFWICCFLFGQNWQTSASALAAVVAFAIYKHPEVIHGIAQPWQTWIWYGSEAIFLGGVFGAGRFAADRKKHRLNWARRK